MLPYYDITFCYIILFGFFEFDFYLIFRIVPRHTTSGLFLCLQSA
uniref:Uncharacterized protein n=1 Tax=Microviridae sp. ctb4Q28 TaxID=2825002 RepID=A0A8S5UY14_9VIRU|nr:MAG TPA: hypothetical protein [Microviridae sp. ctb4Q28]